MEEGAKDHDQNEDNDGVRVGVDGHDFFFFAFFLFLLQGTKHHSKEGDGVDSEGGDTHKRQA